ncbi:hypothetical protein MSG28_015811 [Choristoneura fumiferana]|uniref:Uncharacterized protein n=1 Tax=Choristoneura fumiferana TaxID=7141 RepID=A0ACC0KCD8_CHOFU|nr:hypothetical protein MSG28_015811 [Choristoneura fumiferana]
MNPLINLHLNRTLGVRRKWHQNVMNLLLGKSMCGSCLRLDDDLIQWDVNFVLRLDGSEAECTLKNIMLFTFGPNNHNSKIKQKRAPSYKCNECSFVSFNKSSLEAHINKAHLRIRPHVCPVCLKGFFKKSNLTDHVRIHEKVITETCEVCGDNFSCKKSLMWHLRLHNNETPYECNICSKKFVTSGRRHDHVKRKHMEKTECCLFCNKMFSLKRELNRHVKRYHSEKEVDRPREQLSSKKILKDSGVVIAFAQSDKDSSEAQEAPVTEATDPLFTTKCTTNRAIVADDGSDVTEDPIEPTEDPVEPTTEPTEDPVEPTTKPTEDLEEPTDDSNDVTNNEVDPTATDETEPPTTKAYDGPKKTHVPDHYLDDV